MTEPIVPGSTVTLHYTLALPDGTVADTTGSGEPLTFTLGTGTMIEGLEHALMGLKPGDHQELKIPPESGYGFPDPEARHPMPRSSFPEDMTLEVGMIMSFDFPDGGEAPGAIISVDDDEVLVDFNHPLAGMEVTFTVDIIDVKPPQLT